MESLDFQKFMSESKTKSGRERQEARSSEYLRLHGRASELVDEDEEEVFEEEYEHSLPPPLKREA